MFLSKGLHTSVLAALALLSFVAITLTDLRAAPRPDSIVKFNEVHYNPLGANEDGEWIEFFNQMGIKTDISGWYIDGVGGYEFPQGTIVEPGGYLVVYKSPGLGELGPFTGSLSNGGETLRLYNQSDRLMDELSYGDDDRWPAAADGSGVTLAKKDPYSAAKPAENWAASEQVGGTPGTVNFPDQGAGPPTSTVGLLVMSDDWRYNESGADLGSNWASSAHAIGGDWEEGPGALAFENGLIEPAGTSLSFPSLNNPYVVTYYFEREFDLTAGQAAAIQSLQLRHMIDDGAIFYVNGIEVLRVHMPGGPVTAATLASSGAEVEELGSTIPISAGAVVAGTNRISVEVHQASTGSSDIVFGAELDAVIEGIVPGGAIPLLLNEIPPSSEPNFWLELVNAGPAAADIGGMIVSADGDPLRSYTIPPQSLEAGSFLLLDEVTLGFRPLDGEKVFIYNDAATEVVDAHTVTGRLRGRASSMEGKWLFPDSATPNAANVFTFNEDIVISEIMYNPPALPATPDTPATFTTTNLLAFDDVWRYNDTDDNLPSNWASNSHAVGGNWSQGQGAIGFESSTLPEPLRTTLNTPGLNDPFIITYYFEREFNLTAQELADTDSLLITHQVDDGAVFYLNGTEIQRFNMPGGAVGPETTASPSVSNATLQSFSIPPDALLVGNNRISVEVHQQGIGSSDIVFALKLDAQITLTPFVPGMPFRNSDNQWLELANKGTTAVDIGGWDFGDGVNFVFPPGTMLAPGEHACIASDAAQFSAAYPGARLLGEFQGSLSRSNEHLLLRDANNNPVDEFRYYDGGRWPDFADGGGSSLELRDLDADNNIAESWAASDESSKTSWGTYSYRGTAAASRVGPDNQWREFIMGMVSAGEILIDDISVVENPDGAAIQFISNTNFESGDAGWRNIGTHGRSEVIPDPDDAGNNVLHLVATGPTEHMHNHCETTLANGESVRNGQVYEISFRARWVTGSNQLNTRLYFNRMARVSIIDRVENGGTPSAPNSTSAGNIGPSYSNMKHAPVVPSANIPVTVTVEADDPNGVSTMTLHYSTGGAFQSVGMSAGSGGTYQGSIPGQSSATVVQFYVEGTDGQGASSFFPAAGPDSRACYKVNDGFAATNGLHNFRIVIPTADATFLHSETNVMSNNRMPVTVIDREGVIYYNVGLRLKGSERARSQQPRVGWNLRFNADQLYNGIHGSVALDRSEGVGTGQKEFVFDTIIANSGGILSRYYDLVQVMSPQDTHRGPAVLQLARYGDIHLGSQFENGDDGNLYEYELIYYPTTVAANGLKRPQPDGVVGTSVRDLGDEKENYRWNFILKNNRDRDDFGPIIAYNKKFSQNGAAFEDGLDEVVDVDGWLRGMAYAVISAAGDNAGAGSQHNGYYYAKPNGQIIFLPHDMDFAFDTGRSILANPEVNKLTTSNPVRMRIYCGHLHDIVTTTANQAYMEMWTTHFNSLAPQNWSGHLSSINSRASNVLNQINSRVAPIAFNITTSSPLNVNGSTATVNGDGWVNVREIRLAGNPEPLPATWTDNNSWSLTVPVSPGANTVTLESYDFSGILISSDTITINNTSPTEPASASNLVISEIMYHPADPTPAEVTAGFIDADSFEYIEIKNIAGVDVDLTNAQFTSGINHALPATTIAPGACVVLARDRTAFLSRHPAVGTSLLPGEYGTGDTNKLSNSGEEIALVDAAAQDIKRFSYNDNAPWPTAADGAGYSLVLIDPGSNPDHSLAANWRSSAAISGNPGATDSIPFTGNATDDDDNDDLNALLEHALGTSDSDPGSGSGVISSDIDAGGHFVFSYQRSLAADDVIDVVELSSDLAAWNTGPGIIEIVSEVNQGDGTSIKTWRSANPVGTAPGNREFARLRVTER